MYGAPSLCMEFPPRPVAQGNARPGRGPGPGSDHWRLRRSALLRAEQRDEPLRILGRDEDVVEQETADGVRERRLQAKRLDFGNLRGVADRLVVAEQEVLVAAASGNVRRLVHRESGDHPDEAGGLGRGASDFLAADQ